jgi:hypothetical protein
MTRGKYPVMCVTCGHTESVHIYQGWGLPMPCLYRPPPSAGDVTAGWCRCPDFQEPDQKGPDDAEQ